MLARNSSFVRASFLALAALVSIASTGCGDASASGASAPATGAPPSTAAAAAPAKSSGAPAAAPVPAGTGKPSAAECDALSQKFLDLAWDEALAEDEDLRKSSAAEKELIRKTIMSEAKNDPDFKSISADCRKELSRKEYNCLISAKNMKAFDKCIPD